MNVNECNLFEREGGSEILNMMQGMESKGETQVDISYRPTGLENCDKYFLNYYSVPQDTILMRYFNYAVICWEAKVSKHTSATNFKSYLQDIFMSQKLENPISGV